MANPLSTLLTSERESQIEKDNANLLNKLEVIKKKGTHNAGLTSVSISLSNTNHYFLYSYKLHNIWAIILTLNSNGNCCFNWDFDLTKRSFVCLLAIDINASGEEKAAVKEQVDAGAVQRPRAHQNRLVQDKRAVATKGVEVDRGLEHQACLSYP